MQEGRINTSTATSGAGGNVTINASVIEMSGEFPNPDFGDFSALPTSTQRDLYPNSRK